MRKQHYRREELKETELHEKMKQGFDKWVRNLPSMPPDVGKSKSEDPKKEQTAQGTDATNHSDNEDRWQDDGGTLSSN
jgi:hypothetical protein